MEPETLRIQQIEPGLWAMDEIGRTTVFLCAGNRKALLLDTGFGLHNWKQIIGNLCPGLEICAVNTHAHGDHIGGNDQFDHIWVGLQDCKAAAAGLTAAETESFRSHFLSECPLLKEEEKKAWHPAPCRKIVPLHDGDIFDLGGKVLEVLETPGHTRGSICLLDKSNGNLFTGDLMLTWNVWGHLPESAPLEVYGHSIHRLRLLQPQRIFPSHGKDINPSGWPWWEIGPEIIGIYDDGIQKTIAGEIPCKPYSCFLGEGLLAEFTVGGITYRSDRIFA